TYERSELVTCDLILLGGHECNEWTNRGSQLLGSRQDSKAGICPESAKDNEAGSRVLMSGAN
ncbi:MAG: hypothetical protein AAB736_02280, partial [Patescibacteria group bacterium]